jgi:hypothetical protein
VLGAASVFILGFSLKEPYPLEARHEGELRPLFLRGSVASTVSKAHLPLLIDLYWLRTLIGIAEPESEQRNKNIYAYGDFLTDLDPRFFHAYYFPALATPYSLGNDRFLNGDLALKLVRKGIARFPEEPRLQIQHAFLLTYIEHDSRAAVEVFMAMTKLPNAPAAAIASATALFVEENRFDEAIALISEALGEGGHGSVKMLSDRKKQLEIERQLRALDAAILSAAAKIGHVPESLEEVVKAGEWPAEVTHDQEGGELSVEAGRGRSSWLVGRMEGIPKW